MADDLIYAVTGGPAGTQLVQLPDDRLEALKLKVAHRDDFWCSTKADGCGDQLVLCAGPIVRPYFRHQQRAACHFIDQPASAAWAYEHLRYQHQLVAWLEALGYQPTIENYRAADGRTDLHVQVDRVSHSIEVQLSPIAVSEWTRRDGQYRRHANHVTWLYGQGAEAAAVTELADRGVVLRLRPGPRIGVLDVAGAIRWSTLAQCWLTADGFHAPGIREALELHAERERGRAAQAAADAETQARWGKLVRRAYATARATPLAPDRWTAMFPEAAGWQPSGGWAWLAGLPEHQHAQARSAAYTTQRLEVASPTADLLPDVRQADRHAVIAALVDAGLITITVRGGLERWQRAGWDA